MTITKTRLGSIFFFPSPHHNFWPSILPSLSPQSLLSHLSIYLLPSILSPSPFISSFLLPALLLASVGGLPAGALKSRRNIWGGEGRHHHWPEGGPASFLLPPTLFHLPPTFSYLLPLSSILLLLPHASSRRPSSASYYQLSTSWNLLSTSYF